MLENEKYKVYHSSEFKQLDVSTEQAYEPKPSPPDAPKKWKRYEIFFAKIIHTIGSYVR